MPEAGGPAGGGAVLRRSDRRTGRAAGVGRLRRSGPGPDDSPEVRGFTAEGAEGAERRNESKNKTVSYSVFLSVPSAPSAVKLFMASTHDTVAYAHSVG